MASTAIKFGNDKEPHTAHEEFVHALTHGVGALLAAIALVFLIVKAVGLESVSAIVSVTVYAACAVVLYVSSTLYHGAHKSSLQPLFKMFDHSAIYLKIAGTYTPIAIITLQTTAALWVLTGVWIAALVGVALKSAAFVRKVQKEKWLLSLLLYLAMGWSGLLLVYPLYQELPGGFAWIVAGGLSFTFGTIFYAIRSVPYMHAVWHLFVMGGSACHFVAIYFYVI